MIMTHDTRGLGRIHRHLFIHRTTYRINAGAALALLLMTGMDCCDCDDDGDGYSPEEGDCNDADADVHPGAVEVCNREDDNCDGLVDNDAVDADTWFIDQDGDTYGLSTESIQSCTGVVGYVDRGGDCNDQDPSIYPWAPEKQNGIDDDCDGRIDEPGAIAVRGGSYHTLTLMADGTIYASGQNGYGQLGNGEFDGENVYPAPVKVLNIDDAVAISAGATHSLALLSDGSVWAWGGNAFGQLGYGTEDSAVPQRVDDLPVIVDVAAGYYHSLALAADGSVWAWGQNISGQLGDGNPNGSTPNPTPRKVTGLEDIVLIGAGWRHSLAAGADGTLWAWGSNSRGQLGDGTTTQSAVPVQVLGFSDPISLEAGAEHSVAVRSDGSVWSWGDNEYGQLGDGTTLSSTIPVRAIDLHGIREVAAGDDHSMALHIDGRVFAWGQNGSGQLGNGTSSLNPNPLPDEVLSMDAAASIDGGCWHSVATDTDLLGWGWGFNAYGELGVGTTEDALVPTQILLP